VLKSTSFQQSDDCTYEWDFFYRLRQSDAVTDDVSRFDVYFFGVANPCSCFLFSVECFYQPAAQFTIPGSFVSNAWLAVFDERFAFSSSFSFIFVFAIFQLTFANFIPFDVKNGSKICQLLYISTEQPDRVGSQHHLAHHSRSVFCIYLSPG
jgi:hypothetical protein